MAGYNSDGSLSEYEDRMVDKRSIADLENVVGKNPSISLNQSCHDPRNRESQSADGWIYDVQKPDNVTVRRRKHELWTSGVEARDSSTGARKNEDIDEVTFRERLQGWNPLSGEHIGDGVSSRKQSPYKIVEKEEVDNWHLTRGDTKDEYGLHEQGNINKRRPELGEGFKCLEDELSRLNNWCPTSNRERDHVRVKEREETYTSMSERDDDVASQQEQQRQTFYTVSLP